MTVAARFPSGHASVESRMIDLLTAGGGAQAWTTDLDLNVTAVRGGALRSLGVDASSLIGRNLIDLLNCPEGPDGIVTAHMNALSGERAGIELGWGLRFYALDVAPLHDAAGAILGCVGAAFDVTELRRAARDHAWLLKHDELTGLANRALFRETLSQAVAEARRVNESVTVVQIDLDDFHTVNSALGEQAGDDVLRAVAERIRGVVGRDGFVARTGGDEFAALVVDRDGAMGRELVDRMEAAFRAPFPAGDRPLSITASVGTSVFPYDATTVTHLLRASHFALRRSKDRGGNQQNRSTPSVTVPALERLDLTNELQGAMERGELSLHYQPLLRLSDQSVVSMEALLRWNRGGQILTAANFIRVAEESHLIVPIGNFVIEEACRQWAEWNRSGMAPDRIAINIGARHVQHDTLVATVRAALERHGVPPRAFEIEITETAAMDDVEATMHVMNELRSLGVEITIDDFGTGHSSLAYLLRFAFTGLKIDRSFVSELPGSSASAALVRAIVATGRALGLRIVAEGIELAEQADWLREQGCDDAQGYLFARPGDAATTGAYLRDCLNSRKSC